MMLQCVVVMMIMLLLKNLKKSLLVGFEVFLNVVVS
jgi:hypothetical protein